MKQRYSHKGRKPVRRVKVSDAVRKATRKGFLGERVSPGSQGYERETGQRERKNKAPPDLSEPWIDLGPKGPLETKFLKKASVLESTTARLGNAWSSVAAASKAVLDAGGVSS